MNPGRLWLLFAAFIVYGATIPFHFASDLGHVLDKLRSLPLSPLVAPDTGQRLSFPDVVQNVLLFLPFGALGFLTVAGRTRGTSRTRWTRSWTSIALVSVLGATLSAAVEGLQLFTSDRVSSLGDVTANTAGAFLGAVLAWQLRGVFAAGLRQLRREGMADVDELRPLAIASLLLAIAFWQPFDVTLEVGTVVGKVRNLETNLWQFSGLSDEGTSVMLSAFFAMTFASYLSTLGEQRPTVKAAVTGIGLVCLLESSQIFIGSRMPGPWDALVASAGVAIGVSVWTAASRVIWPGLWLGVLWAITFAAAALQMLSPFDWTPVYHSMGWFPFFGYYVHTTFETLSHVIELVLLYFPLGFFVGQTHGRKWHAAGLALGLTLAIAGPIEYLQGFVVGRYPDVTDIAVCLGGGWLAAWAGRVGMTRT